jgi:hypothetical protein
MAAPVICPQCGRVLKNPVEQADPQRLCSRCRQLAAASVPSPDKDDFPSLPSIALNLRPLARRLARRRRRRRRLLRRQRPIPAQHRCCAR